MSRKLRKIKILKFKEKKPIATAVPTSVADMAPASKLVFLEVRGKDWPSISFDDGGSLEHKDPPELKLMLNGFRKLFLRNYDEDNGQPHETWMASNMKDHEFFVVGTKDKNKNKPVMANFKPYNEMDIHKIRALITRYRLLDFKRAIGVAYSMEGFNNQLDYQGPYFVKQVTMEAIKAKKLTYHELIIDSDGLANGPKSIMEDFEKNYVKNLKEEDWRNETNIKFETIMSMLGKMTEDISIFKNTMASRVDNVETTLNQYKVNMPRSSSVGRLTRSASRRSSIATESGNVASIVTNIESGNSTQTQVGQRASYSEVANNNTQNTRNKETQPEYVPINYNGWCAYEKCWTDHDARRCPKKADKPTGCWKCKRKGHNRSKCPNEYVPGAEWGPKGPPGERDNSYRKKDSNYQTSRQIYRRANMGPPPDQIPSACKESDSDAVKLMAKEFLEATKSDANPEGNDKFVRAYVKSKNWEEEDLFIREKAKKKEFIRAAKIEQAKKEECLRTILISGVDDETKNSLGTAAEIRRKKGLALFKAVAHEINDDILKTSHFALNGEEDVMEVEVIAAEPEPVTEVNDDGKDVVTLKPQWDLRVELVAPMLVNKILNRYELTNEIAPQNRYKYKYAMVLTESEMENDEYVQKELKARNDKLVEKGANPDWKVKGKPGVLELTRGLWEDQAREQTKEKEQAQKRSRDKDATPPHKLGQPPQLRRRQEGNENANEPQNENEESPQEQLQRPGISTEELFGNNNNAAWHVV